MQKLEFAEAIDLIIERNPRFDREAYYFLRDALDFTVKGRKKAREASGTGHVSGQQLLEGVRLYAIKQFGPMVVTVLDYWGVRRCEDFGEMVYNLIDFGVFGKTDTDSIEDFKGGYNFKEAFVDPYQPIRLEIPRRGKMEKSPVQKLN
jgi:uncharacterized repeat protein (TIGR04138 family)